MNIRVGNLLAATSYSPVTPQKTKNSVDNQPQSSSASSVSISRQAQTALSASQVNNVSSQNAIYDFTNITPENMASTMNGLIKSGKLSFDDSSALVTMIPTALSKVNYDGQAPQATTQPTNFIALLQEGVNAANARGDASNAKFFTNALDALQKLQATPIQT